MKIEEQ